MKYKCPICKSKSKEFIIANDIHGTTKISSDTFEYYKCGSCDAIFLVKERFSSKFYKKYYPDKYYKSSGRSGVISEMFTKVANYSKAKIVEQYAKSKKSKILDIGAGELKFLSVLSDQFDKYAIDINKPTNINKKINFIKGDISSKKIDNDFNLITMWHFLEHYPDPVKLFKKLKTNVTKDGCVIFSMPNTDSIGFKIAKENWYHFDAPRHAVLYNEKTVKKLAELSGFKFVSSINLWFEFPTDLYHSAKNSRYKNIIYLFYPILKFLSKETKCYVFRKV